MRWRCPCAGSPAAAPPSSIPGAASPISAGDGFAWRHPTRSRATRCGRSGVPPEVGKPGSRAVIDGRIRFFGHDGLGAERVRAVGERLRLPASATRVVETLIRHHLRPMHLEQAGQVTRRARYRFFRDLGDESRDLLLLTLADGAAVRGLSPFAVWPRPGLVRELLADWPDDRQARAVPSLLRGEDVMGAFGLAPGPAVGQLLARAREAQDTGLGMTREQALAHLRIRLGRRPLPPGKGSVI